ncbi:hypothetical protein HNP49_001249 [Pseudomonas fluvialis]|uniref:Plasmid mobilization relaxosome protein MobC n=1 Tax=Pseudomonas fluvialis TaxID=1793966 RepID=A0A7X0BR33_9PSED|nr:hypothetical protein [Pseudomonas fluvialis]MBB6341092.1 hypothetical protein [Pseudomonas fluvialis]
MKAKRKPGPIPRPKDKKKLRRISVFFTESDYQQIEKKAGSISAMPAYIRASALKSKPAPVPAKIPAVNLEAWVASSGLQNNLNQLVRLIHAQGISNAEIETARELVAGLRAALLTTGGAV